MIAQPTEPVVIALDHRGAVLRHDAAEFAQVDIPSGVGDLARRCGQAGVATFLAAELDGEHQVESGVAVLDTSDGLAAALALAAVQARGTGTYVDTDRVRRSAARRAGWRTVPHEELLEASAGRLRFLRIVGPVDLTRLPGFVPCSLDDVECGVEAIGIGDERTMAAAAARRAEAQVLGGDPSTDDLVRVHLDRVDDGALAELARRNVIHHRPTTSGVGVAFVAMGPDESVDDLQLHGAHGHVVFLPPRPELLDRPASFENGREWPMVRAVPRELLEVVPKLDLDLSQLLAASCSPDSAAFQADVDRYSGAAPLDGTGTIVSRHVRHPHNDRVVDALLADLRGIGYCAWTHSFSFEGRTVRNVLAELPGRGYVVIRPDLELLLRELLLEVYRPDASWCRRVESLLADVVPEDSGLFGLEPLALRHRLADLLQLRIYWPWWCLRPAAGFGAELVVVGCHLDSTAASDGGFDSTIDPAPGADDDASGIATVLCAARRLWAHRNSMTHTVRFAFFNAEEVGLVGSGAYASMLKSDNAPVKAVVCADMVGYNSDANEVFEVHAGATNAAVRDLSVPIAQRISSVAASQGNLAGTQIYKGTAWPPPGNADRNLYDGAIDRSDHASFHAQGYGAVVVSEDFFANLASEPASDANPNYHRAADQVIDATYGARIACAVSESVRQLAN